MWIPGNLPMHPRLTYVARSAHRRRHNMYQISLPKLEIYNEIKHELEPETYLGVVKFPDARKSLTSVRLLRTFPLLAMQCPRPVLR